MSSAHPLICENLSRSPRPITFSPDRTGSLAGTSRDRLTRSQDFVAPSADVLSPSAHLRKLLQKSSPDLLLSSPHRLLGPELLAIGLEDLETWSFHRLMWSAHPLICRNFSKVLSRSPALLTAPAPTELLQANNRQWRDGETGLPLLGALKVLLYSPGHAHFVTHIQ